MIPGEKTYLIEASFEMPKGGLSVFLSVIIAHTTRGNIKYTLHYSPMPI